MELSSSMIWKNDFIELFILTEEHVTDRYVAWLNDPEINRYLEIRFGKHTRESTRTYIKKVSGEQDVVFMGIRYLQSDEMHVGNIKLELNKVHGLGKIGIMIGEKSVHGRGVASEAIKILSKIAREELGLRKLIAGCYGSNKASSGAFLKAGFSIEGQRSRHYIYDGGYEDLVLMGLHL